MKYLILLASLTLVACGGADKEADMGEAVEEASESLDHTMHDAVDAAEEVEDELMHAKEHVDDAVDEANDAMKK